MMPPELKETPEAPKQAAMRLEKMGPMSKEEKIMTATMALAGEEGVCGGTWLRATGLEPCLGMRRS